MQRVFHPVAVHFKGSGFYNTDYGKKKARARRRIRAPSRSSKSSESKSSDSKSGRPTRRLESSSVGLSSSSD